MNDDEIDATKYCVDCSGYLLPNIIGVFQDAVEAMMFLKAEGDTNYINTFLPKGSPHVPMIMKVIIWIKLLR